MYRSFGQVISRDIIVLWENYNEKSVESDKWKAMPISSFPFLFCRLLLLLSESYRPDQIVQARSFKFKVIALQFQVSNFNFNICSSSSIVANIFAERILPAMIARAVIAFVCVFIDMRFPFFFEQNNDHSSDHFQMENFRTDTHHSNTNAMIRTIDTI